MHWTAPQIIPPIGPGEVQIWRLDLAQHSRWCDPAALTEPERQRAARMRVPLARQELIAARRLLRTLLGSNLGIPASELVFAEGRHGKPYLPGHPGIDFNVSHSHGLILIALSTVGAVGIDLEFCDRRIHVSGELLGLARTGLPPASVAAVEQAPDGPERIDAFYTAWTRKEAVAKADGRGIAEAPGYREIDRNAAVGRVLLGSPPEPQTTYFVRSVAAGPQYRAALATLERGISLQMLDATHLSG